MNFPQTQAFELHPDRHSSEKVFALMPRLTCTPFSKHFVCLCMSKTSSRNAPKGTHRIENRMKTYIHASSLSPTRSSGEVHLPTAHRFYKCVHVKLEIENCPIAMAINIRHFDQVKRETLCKRFAKTFIFEQRLQTADDRKQIAAISPSLPRHMFSALRTKAESLGGPSFT